MPHSQKEIREALKNNLRETFLKGSDIIPEAVRKECLSIPDVLTPKMDEQVTKGIDQMLESAYQTHLTTLKLFDSTNSKKLEDNRKNNIEPSDKPQSPHHTKRHRK